MKKVFLVFLGLGVLFLLDCENKNSVFLQENDKIIINDSFKNISNKTDKIGDFKSFFNEFNKDTIFQISRIIYPVEIKTFDYFTETDSITYLKKNEWKPYLNVIDNKEFKYIVEIEELIIDKETKVNIQIEDTGVYVDYYFKKIDNQWYLYKIEDRST
jgi:hypothetical protein